MENLESNNFTPPRHWIGTEELNPSYWSDPKVIERRGQEFHDKPVETIDLIDRMDKGGIARRDFLTLMGASMAMATMACARRPVHKIIPYVVKPEEIIPGVPNFYASTHPETGYGVLAKTREGRPVKLEGNPDHPINQGKLNARIQASVLGLYDPDRLQHPLARTRGGASHEVSWQDADAAIVAKLKTASRVRILSDATHSESTRRLVQEFLGAFSNGAHVEYTPLGNDDIAEAAAESYGSAVIPKYDFSRADVILSLGADFLGTWVSPVEFAREWATRRKLENNKGELSKFYMFEPSMTNTGANADERYGVRPGDELKVALAVANELIVVRKVSRLAGDGAVGQALAGYKPEVVAQEIGLTGGVATIRKVADSLWKARGRSLVVAGGIQSRTRDAVALQIATNLLNSVLENEGATVNAAAGVAVRPNAGFAALAKLVAEMKAGSVEVLIIHGANPAYALPKALGFVEASKKVPLVITVSDRDDETAFNSDYVLPDHHWLENWGDSQPRPGVMSIQQPTIAPLFSTRAFQDTLLSWVRGGVHASGLAARIATAPTDATTMIPTGVPANDWHTYLMTVWREGGNAGNNEAWESVLRDGLKKGTTPGGGARAFRSGALSKVPAYKAAPADEVRLALYESVAQGDGRYANNPWLQEMPDPVSTITWDNYLNVGPDAAAKLGVKTHDVVEFKVGDLTSELPVCVQPGIHPMTVTAAIGYGRTRAGKVGDGVGVDLYPFTQVEDGRLVYSGFPITIRKTGKYYNLAQTQWHHASENRPVVNDITLAEFKKDPATANETSPELRLEKVPSIWPRHEYKGYRWGMAIDLNSCMGCHACVIACQAENNVPVVGRNNVRVSREMHWIRIDRYYSGDPQNPQVIYQPMLCQHCENAPCETVCPVLATVHNDEGLNIQAYNRCVGTRYCSNNCPYKVRRFNFFDHWKSYEGTMNMAWNPDVTVRTRGIMEKCTFCVQRIQHARDDARLEGRKIREEDLKVACQQTCPTDAIVFGNINDPESRVSKLHEEKRAFRSLEVLNTRPSISYLTKVRNVEPAGEHGTEGAHHV